jgi:tRNA pseudouridine synthase 10
MFNDFSFGFRLSSIPSVLHQPSIVSKVHALPKFCSRYFFFIDENLSKLAVFLIMPVVKASDIESTLASIQAICNRCILRFKGCRDPIELTASPVLPELSCPACLNLLNTNHEALSAKIHEQLASKGYTGLSSFLTSIQLPFAPLAIRNRAIRLYLEDALVPFIEAASTEVKKDTSCVESKATEPIVESTEPIVEEGLPETITVREALKHIFSVALTTPTLLPARKSPLHIQIEFNHATLSDAWVWLTTIPSAEFEVRMKRKRGGDMVPEGLSINRVDKALAKLRVGDFKFPLNPVVGECVVESIKFLHEPMWIAGRYNKLARHISNSPWVIDGKRMTVDSVQELIDVVLIPAFGCKGVKFSSAGREDADVKMLGTGRPFYFEILDPKKVDMSAEDVMGLEKMINEGAKERLFVRDLQITTRFV